jgi:hypothetical protein
MGVWSQPICAIPANLKFKKSLISSEIVEQMSHYSYFSDNDKDDYELNDFQMECDINAKIYGYMTNNFLQTWRSFFKQIADQQSDTTVEFGLHFFCIDDNMPYIFKWEDNKFVFYEGQIFNIYYFSKNPKYKKKKEAEFIFDEIKYKKNYRKDSAMKKSNIEKIFY